MTDDGPTLIQRLPRQRARRSDAAGAALRGGGGGALRLPVLLWAVLSFEPKDGTLLGNYRNFFTDAFLYDTIWTTLRQRSRSGGQPSGGALPIARSRCS